MGGGVAWVIKKKGGKEIESEAITKAPGPVGKAILTTGGKLKARHVIHATTMKNPAEKISTKNVRMATRAALECVQENEIKSIAFPGMGTGVGGVDKKEAALVMVEEIKRFLDEGGKLKRVILVGYEEEMYEAFREAVALGL
jgi:O-acetyl-ADP-ribose deacetylase (regulator of RNase III)